MTWCNFVRSLLSANARIFPDKSGASATILAIALPGLIGFGALGAETGVWFTLKLQNQSATDAAALSAAYEVVSGKTNVISDLTPAASEAAAWNGFKGSAVAVIYPYSDSIVTNGVAVSLRQTQRTFLAAIFLSGVTVTTKAVAVIEVLDNPCVLALGTSSTGVEVADFTHLDVPNCSVAANSIGTRAIELHGSTSSIAAATLVTAGEISLAGDPINPAAAPSEFALASPAMIGAPSVADPYASRLTHAFLTTGMPGTPAGAHSWKSVTKTIRPGLYYKGMSFETKAVIDLTPGVYYVTNGDFSVVSDATVTCKTCSGANGITIILTTTKTGGIVGNVHIYNGARVTLQAPNSGTLSGLLFVQDLLAISSGSTTPDNGFEGGPSMKLTGLLYFPKTTVGFQGNPSATCTLLLANQVTIDGDSNFTTSGCTSGGLTRLPTVSTVALAE